MAVLTFPNRSLTIGQVEALQWTGHNLAPCIDFLGVWYKGYNIERESEGKCELKVFGLKSEMIASRGDWLVRNNDGRCYVYPKKLFEELFLPVKEIKQCPNTQ